MFLLSQNKLDLFLNVLAQSKYGSIDVQMNSKSIFYHSGDLAGPNANIRILSEKCLSDFFLKGDLGWAESYVEGNWETSNLTDFLEWGARNFHEFSRYDYMI